MTADETPVPVLRVRNSGEELLELILEPYGSDHWMRPGETFVIWTLGHPGDEVFEVEHEPGTVTVHAESLPAYVGDADGNEIECGHNRPPAPGPFRLRLP
ncbi:hypothetical protein [Streptomyces aurantiogriseus]|uniref:Uncharacterized protein n=1 Tax=Streptomyces aurantiogriseus TaxID=66870 RepID=A0A918KYX2_9ACTN|nr:hypothetical protein [Streptomyces aurantiogriseus]GGR50149.1 hypothetical protein GCM10010251_79010 [Streptomyces aurantiogriseus]